MLKLNIIPLELKHEIKRVKLFDMIKRFSFWLVSFLLIYAAIFISSDLILKKYNEDTIASQASVGKNSTEYIEKVKNINEQINKVAQIQENFISFSDFLIMITKNINPGIKVDQLSVEKETSIFMLSGTADSRDSLLKLKSDLESLAVFEELSLPINNLLKKDDISFTITAKISKYGK